MATRWKLLGNPPNAKHNRLLSLNHNEFLIVPQKALFTSKHECSDGIYKYSSIIGKWTKIIDYPTNFRSTRHFSTIDPKNKIIYIGNGQSKLIKINLTTKSINIITINYVNLGKFPGILFANDNIHVIGGNDHNKHFIYNQPNQDFDLLYDFDVKHQVPSSFPLFLKTRKSIIATVWNRSNESVPVSVMEYKDNKWTDLNITNCQYLFHAHIIATTKEDYLIFMAGIDVKKEVFHQWIFVYDMNNKKLLKSMVEVPTRDSMATITRNEENEDLLTFGFVRKCYKLSKFRNIQFMPFYLIKLIRKWICYETVHLITIPSNDKSDDKEICAANHWTIDVDQIIQRTTDFD